MLRIVIFLLLCLAILGCRTSQEVSVSSQEDPEVLIERLALTTGSAKDSDYVYTEEKMCEVYEVADKLKNMGDKSHFLLIKHLEDDRLSVPYESVVYATVGHACYHILRQQIFALPENYRYTGYWRTGADGKSYRNPYFYQTNGREPSLFCHATIRSWLANRKAKSLCEIQIEALSWLIAKEKSIGFKSEYDKKLYLYPLEAQLQKLKASQRLSKSLETEKVVK